MDRLVRTGGVKKQKKAKRIAETAYKAHYHVPFSKNTRFTGRTTLLDTLEKALFGEPPSPRTALVGLGGVGKTQIALHFSYRLRATRPEYSIFWVPITSEQSAMQAYVEIARKLDLRKKNEDQDIRELVCQHLSSGRAGKWLLTIDNVDDQELVFGSDGSPGIEEYLPQSEDGLILLTTRSMQVAAGFAGPDVFDDEEMDLEEARELLHKSLIRKELLQDKALVEELLTHLTFLPLAITQAAAYLNQMKARLQDYVALLRGAEKDVSRLLGREFRDKTRYPNSRNAVGTTWLIWFDQIGKSDPLAVQLLSFISCIEPKAIPQSILPREEPEKVAYGIGTLCSYSFLVHQEIAIYMTCTVLSTWQHAGGSRRMTAKRRRYRMQYLILLRNSPPAIITIATCGGVICHTRYVS
jgi:hypothetical protein